MPDQVAIVTGGSRGIGAATVRLAAVQGYAVCVNYRADATAADGLVEEIRAAGGRAIAVAGDMAVEADVGLLFETVDRELGAVTALVNNAGITGLASRLVEATPETIRQVVGLNVTGLILCTQQAVARMSTARGGAGGAIVNLSSVAATLGSPGEYTWYAATKAAVDCFTFGLSQEVAREGIRVNGVAPGLIETEIHATSGRPDRLEKLAPSVPMGRAGTADEVAEAILWLLSDKASYVSGTVLRVGGAR
ncbi:MAG: SDR family oxidoreductase [Alphaproteobacteria bacterium]|nr:SDR family oxidoreductase [Alphaproteobacteria bacterium]